MTQPDQTMLLTEVRVTVDGLKASVGKLERAVQGDPDAGTPGLRSAIKSVADELNNETDSLCDRLDKLEQASAINAARQEGVMSVVKWLGAGSLASLVGLIIALLKLFGGGA